MKTISRCDGPVTGHQAIDISISLKGRQPQNAFFCYAIYLRVIADSVSDHFHVQTLCWYKYPRLPSFTAIRNMDNAGFITQWFHTIVIVNLSACVLAGYSLTKCHRYKKPPIRLTLDEDFLKQSEELRYEHRIQTRFETLRRITRTSSIKHVDLGKTNQEGAFLLLFGIDYRQWGRIQCGC